MSAGIRALTIIPAANPRRSSLRKMATEFAGQLPRFAWLTRARQVTRVGELYTRVPLPRQSRNTVPYQMSVRRWRLCVCHVVRHAAGGTVEAQRYGVSTFRRDGGVSSLFLDSFHLRSMPQSISEGLACTMPELGPLHRERLPVRVLWYAGRRGTFPLAMT
jgi:hypothetical protein